MKAWKYLRFTTVTIGLILTASADQRPNIIVIMCDDMGYSDLGCYGSEIQTPNLDKLAANGLRYSQMYNTSKCNTSRSSLLTGRYVIGKTSDTNYDAGPLISEILQNAGYRTLWSGKNHSRVRPPERGFDRFYGFQGGACNFWNPGEKLQDGGKLPHIKAYEWMVNDKWHKTFIPEDPNYFMTDAITDNAISWLNEYEKEDKPFFLYLAYNAPHWPLHAPEKDIAKYKGVYDAGYQKIRTARYKRMIEKGIIETETATLFPEQIKSWERLSEKERKLEAQRMEIHAAMVDNMDQNIGRVINTLQKQGELENTLILFFSDNGASHERDKRAFKNYQPTGNEKMGSVLSYECIGRDWARVVNTPLAKHKATSHEGGICTPMVAYWPKGMTNTGGWNHEPVHLVDIMSTVLDLSHQKYPIKFNGKQTKPLQGTSLVPTFSQKALAQRKFTMGFDFANSKAVRKGKWKLVSYKKGPWELYDMSKDRTETLNLAKQNPELVETLKKEFYQWIANL
ncbi:arylsulfatase [Lentisphaera araneosa HTCC2155]|uniref:Arylsulfatase n=1 Tax=Lentisphaera araneosa HTCC2155 TaxID=313628 RepID=A6DG55_9BACT|nr:sulfatase-like hydrolase/transferase [Lentisphaera araneosa]EDM29172.1 arylsulfatase [Lentisphaera araneosa HTCC2155]